MCVYNNIPPTPPPTPNINNENDLCILNTTKWLEWERVQLRDNENEGEFIIRDKPHGEKSDEREETERKKRKRRTLTRKCCNRCGTWNHIRRVACSKCLANREEMGKGMNRSSKEEEEGKE